MAINVLVVDDSGVGRAMLIKALKLSGVQMGEIHQAPDGAQGLEMMGRHWIDLIFVDVNMPVMNGEQMIEAIRANPVWSDLPIVVVSTESSQTRVDRLVQMGSRFLHKPFPAEAVRDLLSEIPGVPYERDPAGHAAGG